MTRITSRVPCNPSFGEIPPLEKHYFKVRGPIFMIRTARLSDSFPWPRKHRTGMLLKMEWGNNWMKITVDGMKAVCKALC